MLFDELTETVGPVYQKNNHGLSLTVNVSQTQAIFVARDSQREQQWRNKQCGERIELCIPWFLP